MTSRTRTNLLAASLILALLFSALAVKPVYADDNIPPATETTTSETATEGSATTAMAVTNEAPLVEEITTAETAPAQEAGSEQTASTEEGITIESAPTQEATSEQAAPTEEAISAPSSEGTDVTSTIELLADVPEGTEVVVVDENGKSVPLATQEAAQIVVEGDPMWCPAGVTPGGAGCSISYSNLKALVDDVGIGLAPAANGVIWITGFLKNGSLPDSSGASITFDGSLGGAWATWSGYSLTLKGGWTGAGTTINTADASVFNQAISIKDWNADVTLSDLQLSGVSSGDALTVNTTKKITLTRVQANNSTGGRGALMNNTNTVWGAGVGDVLITASTFSDNSGNGLEVKSNGLITVTDITAISNGSDGVYIDNTTATLLKMVSLTGTNLFFDNTNNGLYVLSKSAIKANNLIALANGDWGTKLDNTSATSAQAVTVTGSSQFKSNGILGVSGGLTVLSNGAISVSNITAINNNNDGAHLSNQTSSFAANLTLTGTNIFSDNNNDGLEARSLGVITLYNVTANRNGTSFSGWGALLNNSSAALKGVTLNGVNEFSENYTGGLSVNSAGPVKLNQVTANGNQLGNGVSVDNTASGTGTPQNVTLTTSGTFNKNSGVGLEVKSYGAITASNLSASGNGGVGALNGALLDNCLAGVTTICATVTPKAVTLYGKNVFVDNVATGLLVRSAGLITLNNVSASGNGAYGVFLTNKFTKVSLVNFVSNVVLYGISLFSNNVDTGLEVRSNGSITLQNLNSYLNGVYGVYLDNSIGGGVGNVVVGTTKSGWCNGLSNNAESGLDVLTNGTVTLYNLCNNGNGTGGTRGYGALVHNETAGPLPKSVSVYGSSSYNNNLDGGLYIFSKGAVTLTNVSATDNDTYGVWVDNTASTNASPQNVYVKGYGRFLNNGDDGLYVTTYGAITLYNITANDNGQNAAALTGWGANLDNVQSDTVTAKGIAVYGTNMFKGNYQDGLRATSWGTITAYSLNASWNNEAGTVLDNSAASTGTPGVTLKGASNFVGNTGDGLSINSKGVITLTNVSATDNDTYGVWVDNTASTNASPQNVYVNGYGRFLNNGDDGLYVTTYGAITLYNITANDNGQNAAALTGWGANLDNVQSDTVTAKGIAVYGTNMFKGNYHDGLLATSWGTITANNLTASWNTEGGVVFDNSSAPSGTPGVTLTGLNYFTGNTADGLSIDSLGAISLTKIHADDNGGNGVTVSTNSNITVTCSSMTDNAGYGWAFSLPAGKVVTLKGVYSYGNIVGETNLSGGGSLLPPYRLCP